MKKINTIIRTFFFMELRNKQALIMGTMFPVIMLILMGIAGREESRGDMSYMTYILPGILGMAYAATGLIALPIMLSSYRENGFLLYLKVTPVKIIRVILSLTITQMIIMLLQTVLLLGVCNFALRLNLNYQWDTFYFLVITLFLSSIALVCLGFVISIFAKNVKNTTTIGNLCNLIFTFLGGAFFPAETWPDFLKPIILLNPLTHMISVIRDIMIFPEFEVGNIIKAILFLLITILICLPIAVKKFSYEITG